MSWYTIARNALTQMEEAEQALEEAKKATAKAKEEYAKGARVLYDTVTATVTPESSSHTASASQTELPVQVHAGSAWPSRPCAPAQTRSIMSFFGARPAPSGQTKELKAEVAKSRPRRISIVIRKKPRDFASWLTKVGAEVGTVFRMKQHGRVVEFTLKMHEGSLRLVSSPVTGSDKVIVADSPTGAASSWVVLLKELGYIKDTSTSSSAWDSMEVLVEDEISPWASMEGRDLGIQWDGVKGQWIDL